MKPARLHWPAIRKKIRAHRLKFLFLDFDGTLAAIAQTPHRVFLQKKTKAILGRLSRRPGYNIAVLSGRSLRDLAPRFGIKGLFYAGNHGLEMKGRGVSPPPGIRRAGKKRAAWVKRLDKELRREFSDFPEVWVENKTHTLSLHYRGLPKRRRPSFGRRIRLFQKRRRDWPLVWTKGKEVWEARPSARWDKGDAALCLLKKFPKALPVAIGDDVTDEDMFRALRRRGITIRVGRSGKSRAEYYVRSAAEVGRLLGKFYDADALRPRKTAL